MFKYLGLICFYFTLCYSEVLINQTFSTTSNKENFNISLSNLSMSENTTIYITLMQFDSNDFSILDVCMNNKLDKNNTILNLAKCTCMRDKISIKYNQSNQYVKILSNDDAEVLQDQNALPFENQTYFIGVTNQVSNHSFQLAVEKNDSDICYQPCKGILGFCLFGQCQCNLDEFGIDCSITIQPLEFIQKMVVGELYSPLIIDEAGVYTEIVFDQEVQIQYSCLSKTLNVNFSEQTVQGKNFTFEYFKNYSDNCQNTQHIKTDIIMQLIEPNEVQFELTFSDAIFSLSYAAIAAISFSSGSAALAVGCSCYFSPNCRLCLDCQCPDWADCCSKRNRTEEIFFHKQIIKKLGNTTSSLDCAICQNKFKENSIVRLTQCNHVFHVICLREYRVVLDIVKFQNCPICKQPLDQISLTKKSQVRQAPEIENENEIKENNSSDQQAV